MSLPPTLVFRSGPGESTATAGEILKWINDLDRAPVHPWPIPDRFEYAVIHSPGEPEPYLAYTIGADFSGQGDTVERAEEMLRECIAVHYTEACRARGIRACRVRARIHPAQAILHA